MRTESQTFFTDLLDAAGPSGDERAATRVWRRYAEQFAEVKTDSLGSTTAAANPGGTPVIGVFGHIDEIGLVIVHIDDEGYLWFAGVGGWTATVLLGQRIRVLTKSGPVIGAIGKKPPHLLNDWDKQRGDKIDTMWIDIGAADGDAARKIVRVGDLAVIEQPAVPILGDRLVSRAVDNRAGAFVAAESVRLYAESPGTASLVGVASVQEETSFGGAFTAGYGIAPAAAIVVDVTHASDYPGIEKTRVGDVTLGGGPAISRGSGVHATLTELAIEAAEAEGIPYQLEASSGATHTDADAVSLTRAGVPSAVISVPNRYMHSPNEIVDLNDLEATAKLVAAIARRLDAVPPLT
jgi:putative aminopeptidase FrvX